MTHLFLDGLRKLLLNTMDTFLCFTEKTRILTAVSYSNEVHKTTTLLAKKNYSVVVQHGNLAHSVGQKPISAG